MRAVCGGDTYCTYSKRVYECGHCVCSFSLCLPYHVLYMCFTCACLCLPVLAYALVCACLCLPETTRDTCAVHVRWRAQDEDSDEPLSADDIREILKNETDKMDLRFEQILDALGRSPTALREVSSFREGNIHDNSRSATSMSTQHGCRVSGEAAAPNGALATPGGALPPHAVGAMSSSAQTCQVVASELTVVVAGSLRHGLPSMTLPWAPLPPTQPPPPSQPPPPTQLSKAPLSLDRLGQFGKQVLRGGQSRDQRGGDGSDAKQGRARVRVAAPLRDAARGVTNTLAAFKCGTPGMRPISGDNARDEHSESGNSSRDTSSSIFSRWQCSV